MRVFVYYNLHKKVWSVKALEGPSKGRVIAHANHVLLDSAEGKVSQAGRERVLREKRKNVHAGIVGQLSGIDGEAIQGLVDIVHGQRGKYAQITYNPYKYTSFVYRHADMIPFRGARTVFLGENREVFAQTA